jgi:hypothetical protein
MNDYGERLTLVICLGQLLGAKLHSNFDLRNIYIYISKNDNPPNFYLPTRGKNAFLLYFSMFGTKSLK